MNTVDLRDKVLVVKETVQVPWYDPTLGDKIKGKKTLRKGARLTVKDHGCWDDPKKGEIHDLTLLNDKGETIYALFSAKELDIATYFKLGRKSRK